MTNIRKSAHSGNFCYAPITARGMIPFICTQTALCIFKNGKPVNKRDTYINVCREIARETKCALIDLNAYAIEKMTAMGNFIRIWQNKNQNRFEKNSICDYITEVLFNFIRV